MKVIDYKRIGTYFSFFNPFVKLLTWKWVNCLYFSLVFDRWILFFQIKVLKILVYYNYLTLHGSMKIYVQLL